MSSHHEGYDAYLDGASSTENPYEYDTDDYANWEAGWLDAYHSNCGPEDDDELNGD